MFESDCSDDEINLSYKSVTSFTKKEDVPLKLWAEHFSKPEKDRNTSLTKIFEKEFNCLKSLYCFLENDQVMGKTLTKFGIPNICGKINKKFGKLSSKRSPKGNQYERRNRTYLSKPHLLSKKKYFKPSSSKKQDFVNPRYTPVVERWSDTALNKFKSVQKIKSPQTYNFDNDHILEKSKHKNATPPTTPTVAITHAELANRTTASDPNTQKRGEGIENHSPSAVDMDEIKGLLKQNDKKYGFKKCVRFNDDDLCSFAPTQEVLESLSMELSNSETTFDEISKDKLVLTLLDNAKTYETVSDKNEQKTSVKTVTNGLGKTPATLPLGISNLQESVCESKMNPKQSFENEKMIETDFEVEPYDNENIVIEDFTESYSDGKNQVVQEKGILLNLELGINETTKGYILKTTDTVQINKERNEQFLVSNNLSANEIAKAKNQEQKPAEKADKDQLNIKNNEKIEKYFLNSKTKIKISDKSLCSSQGKNISGGKIVDSHLKTHSSIGSTQINDNSETKNLFEVRDILVQTSSQQQSNSNELNVSESKDIIVPETPSSDGTTDSKSCKSNVFRSDGCQLVVPNSSEESQLSKASVRSLDSNAFVLETPPSNKTSAGSRSLAVDKTSPNVLESRVENYLQKESHILDIKSSANLLVEDWSDDEFIPLSHSQPQTSSQQQSISNELNVSERRDIIVPETQSLDRTTDSKSCKPNVFRSDGCQLVVPNSSEESQLSKTSVRSLDGNAFVSETPSSNKTSAGSRSLAVDKTSPNVLESLVENYLQKESHILGIKSSANLLVEDWSDDEFIPLSPSQPQNNNESSVNITTINGSIISSDGVGNQTNLCMVNGDNSPIFIKEDKHFENTSNSFAMLSSPCSSLSGRDYISNSSECEEEELLPTKEKYESSNLNTTSQNTKDLKITQEAEISAKISVYLKENEIILNDLHNEVSFSRQTITGSSDVCTPNSELLTGKVGYKTRIQTSFAANAPSKVERNSQTDSSTVEKSKQNISQEEENNKGLNLMKSKSLNSINTIQTLSSENKVRKILFPLQTQSTVFEMENEAKINDTKLVCMTTNSLKILKLNENKKVNETKNQDNQKPMEEKNEKDSCFSDVNLLNKRLNNSGMVDCGLNSEKESFRYSPLPSKSGTGNPSNDLTVTENIIVCENEINEGGEYESSNLISCSQTKNEDPFSVCCSIQNEHDTNLSSHNECASFLVLSKEKENSSASDNNANIFKDKYKSQEVLSIPEASSVDISRQNIYPDFNNKNLARSEMDISMNDEEVSTNKMLSSPNKNVILKSDNVSAESEKIQNDNCITHSYDSLQLNKSQEHPIKISKDEISRNTQLKNDKANNISDKQESALCSNSFSTDSSKQLNINLTEDCDRNLKIKKRSSSTTTKTPVKVCTDNEKSREMECEGMEEMIKKYCNKESPVANTSEHSKAINIFNQTIASVTETSINSKCPLLTSSAIKPHLPTKQIVNSGKSCDIKEDSTTMKIIKITSKIKNKMLSTTKSIKVKNKNALKENSKMAFESIVQSEHKDYNSESPISTSASSNTAHVLSHSEITTNITDTNNTANNNTKRVPSSANESQLLQTTESMISSIQSSSINPIKSMGSENKKLPPKITNETLVTPELIRVSSIKELNENKYSIISENDCKKEAPISTLNVQSKSTNIPSYANENKNVIDTVSAKNNNKIITKRQNVASQISSGINNPSTGDDTGSTNKKMSQISKLVTSSSINLNNHRKKSFAELSDFMVEMSSQQRSISEFKDNETQNANAPGKEASKTTEFPLVPTTSYDIQHIRNDDTGALSSSEKRLKITNQSQLYENRVEKNKNVDASKSRLNDNPLVNDVPKENLNLYSSNVILLSNEASSHNQSKLSDPHQNQIRGGKKDNLQIDKCYKGMQFTTNNIPVTPSRNGQNVESIAYNFATHQEHKSLLVPHQTKQLKKCLTSNNTIKTQSQTPKLDIMIKKLNVSKNENHDLLRINSSSKNKTGQILRTTNLIPINNLHNIVPETESVHPKSIEQEIKKKSSGILLSSENLCVIRSSSHNQQQRTDKSELPESSNQISKKCNNQNVIGYKSLPTIKLQNCKQDNSKEEVKRQTQMQQQDHKFSTECRPQMRLTQNKQWRSEDHSELKEELSNVSISKHLNKNVISYTSSSNIKPLRFGQGNLNEAEHEYKSLIEDSPLDSDNESFNLYKVDKQLSMNDKGRFEPLLTSDDESVQGFSGSIGCTNGNFSPQSSIGNDILSNENFNNNSNSSNKQLKRKFLENLDNYVSDDSNFEASPTKFTRKNMLCASSKQNNTLMDRKLVSSDDCVPSYHSDMSEQSNIENLSSNEESKFVDISPQYDHYMRDMNNLDSIKGSDHTITLTDSPIPSYSDGLNNDYLMSSPTRPDDCEENNSPFYDSNCPSSDEVRNNYYFTDLFDD